MSAIAIDTIDKTARLLIIGGHEEETRNLADSLAADYQISAAPTVAEAAVRLQKEAFSVIILDLSDDEAHLVRNLEALQQLSPNAPVIVIGPPHDSQLIVSAVKA